MSATEVRVLTVFAIVVGIGAIAVAALFLLSGGQQMTVFVLCILALATCLYVLLLPYLPHSRRRSGLRLLADDGQALLDHYVYVQNEWNRPFYDAYVEWSDKAAAALKMRQREEFKALHWREHPETPAYAPDHLENMRAVLKDQVRYLQRLAGQEG